MYYTLFFLCIISRTITSIYYIEDIDSLRFAYSVINEYSIKNLQPHFPGYPVFSFIGIVLYFITNNLGISFSIIGGTSTFIIIIYCIKLLKIKINSAYGVLISLFIIINPMIWLMSNRYMPDLFGLSIILSSFYYLIQQNSYFSKLIGGFLAGISTGIRLSYFPILIAPLILLFKDKEFDLKIFCSFIFGILMWLIPVIYIEGFFSLYNSAYIHTIGHFFDFGGSIITETNIINRIKYLLWTIWSDGLGLFVNGRSYLTLLPIFPICYLLFNSLKTYKKGIENKNVKWIITAMIIYTLWIMLSQNLIYKSRHVLPLITFLIILIFSQKRSGMIMSMSFLYIITISIITFNLVKDHKNGTAIFHLSNDINIKNADVVYSNPLINYYLRSQGYNAKLFNIEEYSDDDIKTIKSYDNIFVVGYYANLFENNFNYDLDTIYYHNPYMNRMWSEIPVFSLTKNEN